MYISLFFVFYLCEIHEATNQPTNILVERLDSLLSFNIAEMFLRDIATKILKRQYDSCFKYELTPNNKNSSCYFITKTEFRLLSLTFPVCYNS